MNRHIQMHIKSLIAQLELNPTDLLAWVPMMADDPKGFWRSLTGEGLPRRGAERAEALRFLTTLTHAARSFRGDPHVRGLTYLLRMSQELEIVIGRDILLRAENI